MILPFFNRLGVRVLMGSIILLLLLFGVYSYITVRFYGDEMTKQILGSANRMSDVIKQSTRYSMLLNRSDDVYQTITMIGKEPGVEGIRIYNKRGEIMFSTDKKEEHTTVDMHTEACFVCHSQEKPLESLTSTNRTRIYQSPGGYRVLGVINPIRNEASCSNGDCHAHDPDRIVLGVLDVRMSLKNLDETVATTQNNMVLTAVGMILLVSLIVAFYLSLTVLKPVQGLMKGAQQISSGNLDYRMIIQAKNELGLLAQAFNEMTQSLQHEKEENQRWSETLQQRIKEKTEELSAIHKQIVHIEKMASLGKLAATVAHELNNPLEAILTYAKLTARRLKRIEAPQDSMKEMLEDVELIARETDRCGSIVKNLLLFSKKRVGQFTIASMKPIVTQASQLVQHHCEISNIRMETHFPENDVTILCDENQIKQALVALFVNAVEAMKGGGTISVDVGHPSEREPVVISISDTGVGISEADIPFIFEPFFSTKKEVSGVGLGLSVVYGIIQGHGGTISVRSAPGKGTTFLLSFPPIAQGRKEGDTPKQTDGTGVSGR
jgi:two-component system, NtrC family, sensor kinase